MEILELFALGGLIAAVAMVAFIISSKRESGSPLLAAMLSAGFAAFTAVQIWQDGIVMFWTNHTANLTGTQVWWDLLISVTIALFLIAPRARKAGMNVPLWTILVLGTASIGLLAMLARVFWLEQAAQGQSDTIVAPSAGEG